MSKFSTSSFKKSLSYAIKGLRVAFKSQQNFRTQLLCGFLAIFFAIIIKFTIIEICILLLVIALVLICELFNSVIEFTLDAVHKNKYSKLVELAKDMSAGVVLISTLLSIIVGILLYINRILDILNSGVFL